MKFNIVFLINHLSTQHPQRALISTPDWPWALYCNMTLQSMIPWCNQCSWVLISLFRAHECSSAWFENKQNILSFKITSPYHFFHYLKVNISTNNKKNRYFKNIRRNGYWKMSTINFLYTYEAEKVTKLIY